MAKDPFKALLNSAPGDLNRAQRRNASKYLKEELRRIQNLTTADLLSGAGYPIDQGVRSILKSCNEEMLDGIFPPFMNVWDIFTGFVRTEKGAIVDYLRLLPERDHAFTHLDFFAFATEEGLKEQSLPRLREISEATIHNYSGLGDSKDIRFTLDNGDAAVISGISMVRHGNHLHWMAIGGPVVDLEAVTAERRQMLKEREAEVRQANAGANEKKIQDTLNPTAIALPGTDDVWRTFAMGLFNLETASHEIRIIAKDWNVTLSVFSDQFEQRLADQYDSNPAIKRLVDKAILEIESNSVMFDVSEALFSLPAYFATKVNLVTNRDIKTKLGSGSQEARYAMKAPADMRVLTRRVSTLDFGYYGDGIERSYTPPRFRVELDGFWRRLAADSVGKDINGNPVQGRTWVRGHQRYKDRPPKVGVVHVKTPIRSALDKANQTIAKRGGTVEVKF